jgi:ABC-type antimicrobial peptide transport system permease subunit
MGIRLLAGRDFSWDDGAKSRKVIIINEATARALWPDGNAAGQTAVASGRDTTVIGVVSDVHETSVEGSAGWQVYYPVTQEQPEGAELVVRTQLPPDSLAPAVLGTLRQLNPNQPAAAFEPLQQIVDHAVSPRRFFMLLVTSFGLFGLILASLGIYGVISYSVTRRTQEIGIRMALGAERSRIARMVLLEGLALSAAGIVFGIAASVASTRLLAGFLFGVEATNLVTYAAVAVGLAVVGVIASWGPARRAMRNDPAVVLRAE